MHKICYFLVILCLLLGACRPKPANSPMPEGPAITNTSTTLPVLKPSPSGATQTITPPPSGSPEPAPSGYIDTGYYSILLPPTLADPSDINWSDEDSGYISSLLEIFTPYCLNTDRLPEKVVQRLESDGSFDLFIVPPEQIKSLEVNDDLSALAIIALGDPEEFTFQDYVASFDDDPKILSEGELITERGVTGSGGMFEHGDANFRCRAGFLGFQSEGHAYYFLFQTSASSFEQMGSSATETLKSTVFYSGPETPRPFITEVPPTTLHLVGDEVTTPLGINLDPASDIWFPDYVRAVFAGLVRLSPELEVVPDLAENWQISSDGTVYTFTLKEGLAFADGKRITAEDVRASWERAADPNWMSPTARTYLGDIIGVKEKLDGKADHISGVEVLDERTLQVTLVGPRPDFLFKLTYPTSFVVDVDTFDWNSSQINASGPYVVVNPSGKLVLERNEFYYAPAKIDMIEYAYYVYLPTDDMLDYFEAGDFDIVPLFYTDSIDAALDPDHPVHNNLVSETDQHTKLVDMNSALPPLDDINVRKALALAIDRDRLIDELYSNLGLPAFTILPPGMPGYDELLTKDQAAKTGYDPEAAVEALNASQYADSLPEIRMVYFLNEDLANLLASMWEETLGVEVEITESYYGELDNATLNDEFHLLLHGWLADYPDPANFLDILYSGNSDFNRFIIQDPLIHGQLEQARSELDNDRRITLYQEIESRLLEEFYTIPILHSRSYFLESSDVDGFLYPGIRVRYLDQLALKSQ